MVVNSYIVLGRAGKETGVSRLDMAKQMDSKFRNPSVSPGKGEPGRISIVKGLHRLIRKLSKLLKG
jgi:hypothetical protein